jgi:hypothetical protein
MVHFLENTNTYRALDAPCILGVPHEITAPGCQTKLKEGGLSRQTESLEEAPFLGDCVRAC